MNSFKKVSLAVMPVFAAVFALWAVWYVSGVETSADTSGSLAILSDKIDGLYMGILIFSALLIVYGVAGMLVVGKLSASFHKELTGKLQKCLSELPKTNKIEDNRYKKDIMTPSEVVESLCALVATCAQSLEKMDAELAQSARECETACSMAEKSRAGAEVARCQSLTSASTTLGESIESISAQGRELDEAVSSASSAAERQRQLSEETSVATDQMSSAVSDVARSAELASSHAHGAAEQATEGERVVADTLGAISEVSAGSVRLGETVNALGEQADAIGRIMTIISDIADQTNLLALNAAIEAARAGDAGRGFAVVADEVRKLAEKTMEATRDVGSQIGVIQSGVSETGTIMQETSLSVDKASMLAGKSAETMREIVRLSSESEDQVQAIATAASQQAASCEHISTTMAELDTLGSETSSLMARSHQAVAELGQELARLQTLNGVFTTLGSGELQDLLSGLASSSAVLSGDVLKQEQELRKAIDRNRMLELLYMTDANGVQHIPNISPAASRSANDDKARGTNWSNRPWFAGVSESLSIFVSDVYVSQATGQQCVTVAAPVIGSNGVLQGVLAADVRLES